MGNAADPNLQLVADLGGVILSKNFVLVFPLLTEGGREKEGVLSRVERQSLTFYVATASPPSNRTCGFPASGFPVISRLRPGQVAVLSPSHAVAAILIAPDGHGSLGLLAFVAALAAPYAVAHARQQALVRNVLSKYPSRSAS